jgi:hypothetical protein
VAQIEVGRTEKDVSAARFHVRVTDDDGSATEHDVTSTSADLEHLASGYPSPDAFIQACFEFLLERERKESILRAFDISQIATYFPSSRERSVADGSAGRYSAPSRSSTRSSWGANWSRMRRDHR